MLSWITSPISADAKKIGTVHFFCLNLPTKCSIREDSIVFLQWKQIRSVRSLRNVYFLCQWSQQSHSGHDGWDAGGLGKPTVSLNTARLFQISVTLIWGAAQAKLVWSYIMAALLVSQIIWLPKEYYIHLTSSCLPFQPASTVSRSLLYVGFMLFSKYASGTIYALEWCAITKFAVFFRNRMKIGCKLLKNI